MSIFNPRSILSGLAAIALVACGNASGENGGESKTPAATNTVATDIIGHMKGDPNAPHTLIEYASPTCVHCLHFHQDMYPAFEEEFVKTGKVKFVFREFPLNQVDVAAYLGANCLGSDEAFFAMLDDLFKNQEGIRTAAGQGSALKVALVTMAQRHGLADEAAFDACLQDRALTEHLSDTVQTAEEHGVRSTPTFVLDGEVFGLTGATRTGDDFVKLIREKLGEEGPAVAPAETTETVPAE